MQITNDRRSRPRVPAHGRAVVAIGHKKVKCSCLDLSADGAGLLGPFPAASGTNVDLEFSVDGRNISVRARIARARRRRDGFLWGLCFDSIHAGTLADVVATHSRRITWLRQAKPYLDRLNPAGSPASTHAMSIQVGEPLRGTIVAQAIAPEPDELPEPPPPELAEELPEEPSEEPSEELAFDDEPTRVYDRLQAAASEELERMDPEIVNDDAGTVAFEADTLAQLEERDREIGRTTEHAEQSVPPFVPPAAPPVRRPVPTLAAPTVTPTQLRELYSDAVAQVNRRRRSRV